MEDEDEVITVSKKKSEAPPPKRRAKKIIIPRRAPSVVIPGREVVFITPDKTTCEECTCFPKEDPYVKPKKLNPCQRSPLTLYELAASVVDSLKLPAAFTWTEEDVANWMAEVVGLPQYSQCILDNHINGLRLLMLEDPSLHPQINIHDFSHIQKITEKVREAYSVEVVKFARSIGLPPRKPLTHTTWFKSRTGPSWGIRKNWTKCDILRWMKIIMPKPVYLDHWDLVWYHKPDFPKVMFARIKKKPQSQVCIPHYRQKEEVCKEYQVPRKFRLQTGIAEEAQMIWMERLISVQQMEKKKTDKKVKLTVPVDTKLLPKRVSLTGLRGEELVLARRKMAKPKFFA